MNLSETRRHLTARIAAAARYGRDDEVARLRTQLMVMSAESDIRKRLDGHTLTERQVERICEVAREFGPDPSMRTEISKLPELVDELTERLREAVAAGEALDLYRIAANGS